MTSKKEKDFDFNPSEKTHIQKTFGPRCHQAKENLSLQKVKNDEECSNNFKNKVEKRIRDGLNDKCFIKFLNSEEILNSSTEIAERSTAFPGNHSKSLTSVCKTAGEYQKQVLAIPFEGINTVSSSSTPKASSSNQFGDKNDTESNQKQKTERQRLSKAIRNLQEELQEQIIQDELKHKPERLRRNYRRLSGKIIGRKASNSRDFSSRRSKSRAKSSSRKDSPPLSGQRIRLNKKERSLSEIKEKPYRQWLGISKCVTGSNKSNVNSILPRKSVAEEDQLTLNNKTACNIIGRSSLRDYLKLENIKETELPVGQKSNSAILKFNGASGKRQSKSLTTNVGSGENVTPLEENILFFSDCTGVGGHETMKRDIDTSGEHFARDENPQIIMETVKNKPTSIKPPLSISPPKIEQIVPQEIETAEADVVTGPDSPEISPDKKYFPTKNAASRQRSSSRLVEAEQKRQTSRFCAGQEKNMTNSSSSYYKRPVTIVQNKDTDALHANKSITSGHRKASSKVSAHTSDTRSQINMDNKRCLKNNKTWTQAMHNVGRMSARQSQAEDRELHSDVMVPLDKDILRKPPTSRHYGATKKYETVMAVTDFTGTLPGQLSFRKGQTIKVLSNEMGHNSLQVKDGSLCYGYYREGRLRRKRKGLFPAHCVVNYTGDTNNN